MTDNPNANGNPYQPVIYDSHGLPDEPLFGVDICGSHVWFDAADMAKLIDLCQSVDANGTAEILAAPLRAHRDEVRLARRIRNDALLMSIVSAVPGE